MNRGRKFSMNIFELNPNDFVGMCELMDKYGFTEIQVQAILAMTLRRLTGIEEDKLEAEKAQLEANIAEYNHILSGCLKGSSSAASLRLCNDRRFQ